MIAHHKVAVIGHLCRREVAQVFVLRRNVWLGERHTIHIHNSFANFYHLAGQADDALDERLGAVQWIPKDDHVAALDGLEPVDKLVDEDALLVGEERSHAGAFDLHRLIQEDDDDERQADCDQEIAGPDADFVSQGMVGMTGRIGGGMVRTRAWICCWRAGFRGAGVSATGNGRMSLVRAFHFLLPRIYNTYAMRRATNTFGIRRGTRTTSCPRDGSAGTVRARSGRLDGQ